MESHQESGEWRTWATTSLLLIGIWAAVSLVTGEMNVFWPMFPVGIWALVLLVSGSTREQASNDEHPRP